MLYKERTPKTNLRGSESGGYLLSHNAVQYHRRCCLSALCPRPSPLRCSPLSPAHTAARPAPLMHFSQPNDHPSLMGIAKECVNARPWGPQNISNFWGERRHELLLRFSGVVSSSQSRCRPRHLWSLSLIRCSFYSRLFY